MKKLNINKGKHRPGFRIGLNLDIQSVSKKVIFTESCRYVLASEKDQGDICKLFGFSQGHHHYHSARFGWRYNPGSGKIEILAYMYISGERKNSHLYDCEIGRTYEFILTKQYGFTVKQDDHILVEKQFQPAYKYNIGYKLFLYFGGNHPAPQDIEVMMD